MKNKVSPLFSQYILEGVQMEETPFSALYDCLDGEGSVEIPEEQFPDIIDEYLDKAPVSGTYDWRMARKYCLEILGTPHNHSRVNLDFPVSWTISRIDTLLLETLFKAGHFELHDIMLIAKWDWNNSPAGNLAAFYDSTVTAGHYLFDLGLKLDRYFVEENRSSCLMDISLCPGIPSKRKCGQTAVSEITGSDILYIPFCQSKFNLGGSALSGIFGNGAGLEPDLYDPDYFIDCFEVVRELVEDGIILAGSVVSRGGLMSAAEKFRGKSGMELDISGMMGATEEKDPVRLLFSELPGVLVQIAGSDLDYVDSQFLLQEIAYYPVGKLTGKDLSVKAELPQTKGISSILTSLLHNAEDREE